MLIDGIMSSLLVVGGSLIQSVVGGTLAAGTSGTQSMERGWVSSLSRSSEALPL